MQRTVIVTGGGTGIGRAVAAAFAHTGDSVIITGRRHGPLESVVEDLGAGVRAAACDAADADQVSRFATGLGPVDVLVNCAGGNTDFDRPEAADLAAVAANWRANLDANLITAVLMTTAVSDRLTGGGTVISIGSIAADKAAGSYGAAKAGLAAWNISLAAELGPRGITANVVSPGYIAGTEFFRDRLTDQHRDALIFAASTGRAGTPEDVAGTVHFLASDTARQITGQVIAVNGGERTTR
ncbi:SDR family NAD(P)-dependent oxidoreductase [Nocardiopsis ansamitocini]|uniref:3-oxoacyl-ACP reductase n=1 Tax=Nocardiopsis ansamitocini TaxID=1670832 RepID=A0A9W6UIQ2_9ACTN|nr:SDR family oxidoreductase [Nocardiopsis ansamitocini]GLU47673.1 3-oxoacyl-ACP reductase [Nocardiopsis ansamitocini]